MGKSHKEKRTKLIIEGELPRKPKKPRNNGAGFHKDGRKVRSNTRNDQLKNSLLDEE